MRHARCLVTVVLFAAAFVAAADLELPTIDGEPILAEVNGEPITLVEFRRELDAVDRDAASRGDDSPRQDADELLERTIDIRLILQEAVNIGLDQLPAVTESIEAHRVKTERSLLLRRRIADLEPDAARVEELYRDSVKEVKLNSVVFDDEQEALNLLSEIEAGGSFEALTAERIAAGIAEQDAAGVYIRASTLLPQARDVLRHMEIGEVSPPVSVGARFLVLRLEDVRFPDDPELKLRAERSALQLQTSKTLQEYAEALVERHAVVDEALLEELDYQISPEAFDALAEDTRVVATVEGQPPVTVGELTKKLRSKFFHGIEKAVQDKKINHRKAAVLQDIVRKRVVRAEAAQLQIDQSDEFEALVAEHGNSVVFGTFVHRVIDPEIELSDAALQEYMERHVDDFTLPERMRLDRIVFARREDAESALAKLNRGADFDWIRANAAGQIAPPEAEATWHEGNPVVVGDLPLAVRQAVSGAGTGDYRFCPFDDETFLVVRVVETIPARPLPFRSVRGELAKRLHAERRDEVMEEWLTQLREASQIEVHASGERLADLIWPAVADTPAAAAASKPNDPETVQADP